MFSRSFTVNIIPVAKGRPKFRRIGNFVSTYTPKKTASYESEIAKSAKEAMEGMEPLESPIKLNLMFIMPIPVSYSKKRKEACLNKSEQHLKLPDIDNMVKAVCDAMNGIVYKDDGQVVTLIAHKAYGLSPHVFIKISEELP